MKTHLNENCMSHLDNKDQKPMFLVVSQSEVCLCCFFRTYFFCVLNFSCTPEKSGTYKENFPPLNICWRILRDFRFNFLHDFFVLHFFAGLNESRIITFFFCATFISLSYSRFKINARVKK